jgi:hypothetical protein
MIDPNDVDLDPDYKCTECGESCAVIWEDEGIGGYDYHGASGYDENIVGRSECCDADVEVK